MYIYVLNFDFVYILIYFLFMNIYFEKTYFIKILIKYIFFKCIYLKNTTKFVFNLKTLKQSYWNSKPTLITQQQQHIISAFSNFPFRARHKKICTVSLLSFRSELQYLKPKYVTTWSHRHKVLFFLKKSNKITRIITIIKVKV